MNHATVAKRYAREVAAGKRVAGKYTRLACERFNADLKRKDLEFRPDAGARVCRFIEKFHHVKGIWASRKEAIKLEPWQCWMLCNLFGFHTLAGERRFTEAYIRVARKNGKSILGAGIGLYMLSADGEFGAEVYSGATSEKQAWEVFRPARLMAQKDEEFANHYGVEINAKNLNIPEDDSRFEPVIGKPGDGSSPHCAIVDEFHEHKTWDMYNTMVTGMGARANPLVFMITTAGEAIGSPCFEKDDEVKKILSGAVEADRVFGVIYSADDDDDWTSVAAMKKANPNMGVSVSRRYLEGQLESAKRTPQAQAAYKTKNLNLWVSSGSAFLNEYAWRKCHADVSIEQMSGKECIFGVDLASRVDFVAVCKLFFEKQDGNLIYWPFWRFFLPENRLDDDKSGKYMAWAKEGLIELHEDDEIDFAKLRAAILEDANLHNPAEIAYDPWKAIGMEQELSAAGLTMVKIPQTIAHFTDPMNELEAAHLSGRIKMQPNRVADWMAANLIAKVDTNGNKKPRKEVQQNKNDGMVALLMAINRAMAQHEQGDKSGYFASPVVG